jgi:hypothetical protein
MNKYKMLNKNLLIFLLFSVTHAHRHLGDTNAEYRRSRIENANENDGDFKTAVKKRVEKSSTILDAITQNNKSGNEVSGAVGVKSPVTTLLKLVTTPLELYARQFSKTFRIHPATNPKVAEVDAEVVQKAEVVNAMPGSGVNGGQLLVSAENSSAEAQEAIPAETHNVDLVQADALVLSPDVASAGVQANNSLASSGIQADAPSSIEEVQKVADQPQLLKDIEGNVLNVEFVQATIDDLVLGHKDDAATNPKVVEGGAEVVQKAEVVNAMPGSGVNGGQLLVSAAAIKEAIPAETHNVDLVQATIDDLVLGHKDDAATNPKVAEVDAEVVQKAEVVNAMPGSGVNGGQLLVSAENRAAEAQEAIPAEVISPQTVDMQAGDVVAADIEGEEAALVQEVGSSEDISLQTADAQAGDVLAIEGEAATLVQEVSPVEAVSLQTADMQAGDVVAIEGDSATLVQEVGSSEVISLQTADMQAGDLEGEATLGQAVEAEAASLQTADALGPLNVPVAATVKPPQIQESLPVALPVADMAQHPVSVLLQNPAALGGMVLFLGGLYSLLTQSDSDSDSKMQGGIYGVLNGDKAKGEAQKKGS